MRKNRRIENFKEILKMEQEELHYFLRGKLDSFYLKEDIYTDDKNFIYVAGNIPVMLVAHLDTVHHQAPIEEEIFFDERKGVMWSPAGIGGDDRCGVHTVLNILEQGYRPHLVFPWNEEVGCVGSTYFADKVETLFGVSVQDKLSAVNFAIQIDRQGFGESVYYYLDSQEFETYINGFGFETKLGSYTDICQICPEFGFAGVNVSAGYIREHTSSETVFVREMEATERKIINILDDQTKDPKYFKYEEAAYGSSYYGYGWGGTYNTGSAKGGSNAADPFHYEHSNGGSYSAYPDEAFPGYKDSETDLDFLVSGKEKEVQYCEFCYVSSEVVEWSHTDDPVQSRLCDSCRDYYLEDARSAEEYSVVIQDEKVIDSEDGV